MENIFNKAKVESKVAKPAVRRKAVKKPVPNVPILDENGMSKTALKKQRKAERLKMEADIQIEKDYRAQVEETNYLKKLKDLTTSDLGKKNPRSKEVWIREDIQHLFTNIPALIHKLQNVKNAVIEAEPDGFNDNYEASCVTVELVHSREETDVEWGYRLMEIETMILEAEAEKLEKKRKSEENKIKAEYKRLEKIRALEEELKELKKKG